MSKGFRLVRSTAGNKVKVQIDLDSADAELMENLIELLQLGTRAELFRSGLSALGWLAKKKLEGCTVVAITPEDRIKEPEFSFLRKLDPFVPAAAAVSVSAPAERKPAIKAESHEAAVSSEQVR